MRMSFANAESRRMPIGMRAVLLAGGVATLGATPAAAATCGAGGIGVKFSEARLLCGSETPATSASAPVAVAAPVAAAATASAVDVPSAVSITMPTTRAERTRLAGAARAVRASHAVPTHSLIAAVGRRYRVDPQLLAAMMRAESGGRQNAVSPKGALGLMQVMPGTARGLGIAEPKRLLEDPTLALSAGALYLKRLQAKLGNDVPLVVAAYNAGPGAVTKAGMRVPAYRETQGYVGKVMGSYVAARLGREQR